MLLRVTSSWGSDWARAAVTDTNPNSDTMTTAQAVRKRLMGRLSSLDAVALHDWRPVLRHLFPDRVTPAEHTRTGVRIFALRCGYALLKGLGGGRGARRGGYRG